MVVKSWRVATAIALSFIIIFFTSSLITGCASSNVSRDVSSGIDLGMRNGDRLVNGTADGSIADSYQNSTQATKGALLGGLAGGITGAVSSGIGVLEGVTVGAILGASYGAYIDSQTTLEDRLENRGVTVVILGDQVLIMVPSSRLFAENTSQIKPQAFSTLDLIAQFMNRYTKSMVRVAAYTSDTGTQAVSRVLSKHQADQVMRYLQQTCLNARMLYAVGAGGTHLVERNTKNWDSDNNRIEITFEKLYVG